MPTDVLEGRSRYTTDDHVDERVDERVADKVEHPGAEQRDAEDRVDWREKITENLDGRAAAAFGKDPADFDTEDRKHLAHEIASNFKNLDFNNNPEFKEEAARDIAHNLYGPMHERIGQMSLEEAKENFNLNPEIIKELEAQDIQYVNYVLDGNTPEGETINYDQIKEILIEVPDFDAAHRIIDKSKGTAYIVSENGLNYFENKFARALYESDKDPECASERLEQILEESVSYPMGEQLDGETIFKWLDEQSDQELRGIVLLDMIKAKWSEAQRAVDEIENSASETRIEVQALEHRPDLDAGEEELEAAEDAQEAERQATEHKGLIRGLWDRLRGKNARESEVEGAQQASYAMISAQLDALRDALEQWDKALFNMLKDKTEVRGTEFAQQLEEYDWSKVKEFSSGEEAKDWFESKQKQFNKIDSNVDGADRTDHSAVVRNVQHRPPDHGIHRHVRRMEHPRQRFRRRSKAPIWAPERNRDDDGPHGDRRRGPGPVGQPRRAPGRIRTDHSCNSSRAVQLARN